MVLRGARILMESLAREGVDVIFGYPGGAVLDLYDELSRTNLRHILVRHEQGAVHAADGYARATGKVGVCLVTSGPGATNTVTGIATAHSDSIPLVVFTGQVPTTLIGNDAFQEVDIIGITRPCSKHNYLVKDVKDLAPTIRRAFHIARSGRPGPVVVDLPKDMVRNETPFIWPDEARLRSYVPKTKPNLTQLKRAADIVKGAERPLFIFGGGVIMADAAEEATALARELAIPVTSTFMGLGAFPGTDPLWLGMLGMHGTVAANKAVMSADCVIAAGTRFADRVTSCASSFAGQARVIHIDIDPTSLQRNIHVEVPIVGDCREALVSLRAMFDAFKKDGGRSVNRGSWLGHLVKIRQDFPLRYEKSGAVKPQEAIEEICAQTKGGAVITTDVGQHQMWTALFYTFTKPRTLISSGGLGTMGYGLPAAIGAQVARPGAKVIAIVGDGSIQMNIQELITAVQNRLPVKIIILNNGYLGMVRQWQELFYNRNYACTSMDMQPDFVRLAEAYGCEGYRITERRELSPTLAKALASPGPAMVDIRVEPEENVFPMVPTGAGLDEMRLF